ncbi:sialin-like [Haliotis asinina]|uniref:sialin-like n=1 Tax=Haliotis asinina TaxID=109174 RepID=UPI003531A0A2
MANAGEKQPLVKPGQKEVPCQFIQARHVLAIWAFLGFFVVYCLRVNLSVALVAMVNSTHTESDLNDSSECEAPGGFSNTTVHATGEFNWDEQTQGLILGSFFYGYITTQVPGGYLALKFGAKRLYGFGILCTAILTLLTPLAARLGGLPVFIAVRVLEGIGEGVTFPAMHAMWGNWAPILERSKLAGFSYAGAQLGVVFSMPVSGLLCASSFLGGWPSVFYVFGAMGCVWFMIWMLMVHETPADHPRITKEERVYIEHSVGKKQHLKTPWLKIFTSGALWGIVGGHFATNWGQYTFLTCLPTFMRRILKFDIQSDGFLSAVPYVALWSVQVAIGFVADYLRSHGYLSTLNTRRLMNSLGLLLPAGMVIGVSYVGCNHVWAVILLTLALGSSGITMGGYMINHLDIAPKFSGVLLGITNGIATIPGFLGPQLVGIITNNNETIAGWRIVFIITAAVYVFGTIIFVVFARGEEQSWAKVKPEEEEDVVEKSMSSIHATVQNAPYDQEVLIPAPADSSS